MFKEDALVMKTEDVLPIAGNYLVLHPTFTLGRFSNLIIIIKFSYVPGN